jgi:hypothetical protein
MNPLLLKFFPPLFNLKAFGYVGDLSRMPERLLPPSCELSKISNMDYSEDIDALSKLEHEIQNDENWNEYCNCLKSPDNCECHGPPTSPPIKISHGRNDGIPR